MKNKKYFNFLIIFMMIFSLSSCSIFLAIRGTGTKPRQNRQDNNQQSHNTNNNNQQNHNSNNNTQQTQPRPRPTNNEFTVFEQTTLAEINFARTNPRGYAESRLKQAYQRGDDNGAYYDLRSYQPVPPLNLRKKLCIAAKKYARYLAVHNTFGHFANGTPKERCKAEGYRFYSGENIAAGSYPTHNAIEDPELAAISFVKQLIIDKGVPDLGHRKNIMRPTHTHFGAGFHRHENSRYKNYVAHEFGRENF